MNNKKIVFFVIMILLLFALAPIIEAATCTTYKNAPCSPCQTSDRSAPNYGCGTGERYRCAKSMVSSSACHRTNGYWVATGSCTCPESGSSPGSSSPPEPPPCADEACHSLVSNADNTNLGAVSGCYAVQNVNVEEINYSVFGTPGTKIEASGFSQQTSLAKDFYYLEIKKGTDIVKKSNAVSGGESESSGLRMCVTGSDNCKDAGAELGKGTSSTIEYTFGGTNLGGYIVDLKKVEQPIVGEMNSRTSNISTKKTLNVYIGNPSLIVTSIADINMGFYEKFGQYQRKIIFNLINTSPVDINLIDYNMSCTGTGVNCTINNDYEGWSISHNGGKMILIGDLNVNKNYLPQESSVVLNVNYRVPAFENKPSCTTDYNTTSTPVHLKLGLMDYQKFQVGISSEKDFTSCVGENGIVGQTGENFVPRVNIGFGGELDSNDALISIDECDIHEINGEQNPDWVYCSTRELLVSLARKIGKAWDIQKQINIEKQGLNEDRISRIEVLEQEKQKYLSFNMSIRKQALTSQNINAALTKLESMNFFSQTTGLEESYGRDPTQQIQKVRELFENIEFSYLGENYENELKTGIYLVNIKLHEISPLTYEELFGTENELNPSIKISVDFSTQPEVPLVNWFFYDYSDTDFNQLNKNTDNTFNYTNILNRGNILSVNTLGDKQTFDDYSFSPSFPTPIFIRLKSDSNGDINSIFIDESSIGGSENYTFWTGFASSQAEGCGDIIINNDSITSPTLPYRESDSSIKNNLSNSYLLSEYQKGNVLNNSTVYLETILFFPVDNTFTTGNKTINTSFDIYTKENSAKGAIKINNRNNEFFIDNLQSLFDGIKTEKICVNYGSSGTRKSSWILFWNQNKIYETMSERKNSIINQNNDANICEVREILGS